MQIRMQGKNLQVIDNFLDEIFGDSPGECFDSHAYSCLCDHLRKWTGDALSDQDAQQFIGSQTANAIMELIIYRQRGRVFSAAELQVQRENLLRKIIDELQKLPHSCTINFSLPHFAGFSGFPIAISETICLIAGEVLEPSSGGSMGLASLAPTTLGKSNVWLSITVPGYASNDHFSAATIRAISEAKKCIYFLSQFCLFRRAMRHSPSAKATISSPLGQEDVRLPDGLGQLLHSLIPDLEGATTEGARTKELKKNLELTTWFFGASSHNDYKALSAAIEWYIDSITADNQTFAYLAACIGLEAVLGYGESPDRMESMSARLSDRYGWLLGEGRADREKLTKEFTDMLRLRGKLVHARVNRLSASERQKLHDVQDMLGRVIDKEVDTMLRVSLPHSSYEQTY